jgi:hypothetical protein
MSFSAFELSVLSKIAELYGDQSPGLVRQISLARFVKRENTGNGFFTDIAIDRQAVEPVRCTSPLDGPTVVFDGMEVGIDHLLFLKEGYVYLLEGYAVAGESTSSLDFDNMVPMPMSLRYPVQHDIND